jgi:nucleoside-diphosphate-sugar epimerase
MRIVVTGGAGFIGRAVVERLTGRGDHVVALVRDPATAEHLDGERVEIVASDLTSVDRMADTIRGADAVAHIAGSYRVGIKEAERPAMWEANVGTTERVLRAAIDAGAPRILYVSTLGINGNTRGRVVDETWRRDTTGGFLSWYDETKFRAHEVAEAHIQAGAPIVIAMPGQTYGPHDHSLASRQLEDAYAGRLPYLAFAGSGLAWAHVHDLADGLVAALDRGRAGESYSLGGECRRLGEAVGIAARAAGRRPPRLRIPTALLAAVAPINDAVGGLPGMPDNLRETIDSSRDVTYWANHDKAAAELGYAPRSLAQGIADTWGGSPA